MVIPCLNEATSIERCVTEARTAFEGQGWEGEVIVADNGSDDRSAELARGAGALVVHEPRRGYGSAYRAGFAAAQGDYIVMADADLTYDFGDIPRFVAKLDEGADLVMGDAWGHPARRDALAPPLRREPGAHRDPQPLLPHRRARRTLRHAGGPALGPAPPRPADHGDGVRLRDGDPRGQGAARDRRDPDPLPPARGRVEALELPRRLRHLRFLLVHSPTWLFILPGALMAVLGTLIAITVLGQVDVLGRAWDLHAMVAGASS